MHVSYSIFASIMIVILVLSIAPIRFLSSGYFSLPMASSQQSEWLKGRPMPAVRSEVAGAPLNGKLYIIGGFDNSGQSTTAVEVYDPITDEWSSSAPLPQPLDHAAAASPRDALIEYGNDEEAKKCLERASKIDPKYDFNQSLTNRS